MSARPGSTRLDPALSPVARALFWIVPVALPLSLGALVAWPPTHDLGRRLLDENHAVESATFAAFLLAGVWMAGRAARAGRAGVSGVAFWGSGLIAVVFLAMAMEEVSWTQWFFGFETPEAVRDVNLQKEFNFHNLPIIQDLNEWLLAAAGAMGFAWSRRRPRGLWVVPRVLGAGFLVVALLATMELYTLQSPFGGMPDEVITRLVEVAELILALCTWGWAWIVGLSVPARRGGDAGGPVEGAAGIQS